MYNVENNGVSKMLDKHAGETSDASSAQANALPSNIELSISLEEVSKIYGAGETKVIALDRVSQIL